MWEKERKGGEQHVLTEFVLLGEVILDQCQQKLKGKQDLGRITEVAVLKINDTNKIRERYRPIGEIPEAEKGRKANKRQEAESEWGGMGELFEVNSANQIGQLESLRFKMKLKMRNYRVRKVKRFRKMKCLECEREFRRKKRTINTATRPWKSKSMLLGDMGHLYEFRSQKFQKGNH